MRRLVFCLTTLAILSLNSCGSRRTPTSADSEQDQPPKAKTAAGSADPGQAPTPRKAATQATAKSSSNNRYTISTETTFIDRPLTEDGRPDFVKAINKRAAAGITPENNAAAVIWSVCGDTSLAEEHRPGLWLSLGIKPPESGPRFLSISDFVKTLSPSPGDSFVDKVFDNQSEAVKAPWNAKQFPQIAAWLNANQPMLNRIVAATRRSRFYSPMVGDKVMPTGLDNYRYIARALTIQAMLKTQSGDYQGAWEDLQACGRLARLVGQGPTLVANLVAIATNGLARRAAIQVYGATSVTAEQLQQFAADLDNLRPLPMMAGNIEFSERLSLINMYVEVSEGKSGILALTLSDFDKRSDKPGELLAQLAKTENVDWDMVLKKLNASVTVIAKALRNPDRMAAKLELESLLSERAVLAKRIRSRQSLRDYLNKASQRDKALAELISSACGEIIGTALNAAFEAEMRDLQGDRLARVAVALAHFRKERGKYPASLQELTPRYVKSLPLDLFSNKPLRYKLLPNGYLTYSVGLNGKDDGGVGRYDDQATRRGDDLRVKMPLTKESIWP